MPQHYVGLGKMFGVDVVVAGEAFIFSVLLIIAPYSEQETIQS